LMGKLPLKGAQDFERWCRDNPTTVAELGLSDRINAALRLLDAAGEPLPWAEKPLAANARGADAGFQEQSFDEFHLYTLGRPTTLPNNSTKQIELFDQARRVPAQRMLVYASNASFA